VIEAAYDLSISTDAPVWELTSEEKAARDAALDTAAEKSDPITIVRNPDSPGNADLQTGLPDDWDDDESGGDESDADGSDADGNADGNITDESVGKQNAGEKSHFTDDWRPPTEEEADRDQERTDILLDRVEARMEREGPDADYAKILHEEITRLRKERGEPEPTPEQLVENKRRLDEMNAAAEEALNDMKAESWKTGDEEWDVREWHPLVRRAGDFAMRVHRDLEARHWMSEDAHREHPVVQLYGSLMYIGPKLAGAMGDGDDWPPPLFFTAHAIVRLKKAFGYAEDALLAAECCAEQNLTDPAWLADVVSETKSLATEIETIINEQRVRLNEGGGQI
jgi:hypothetical protein